MKVDVLVAKAQAFMAGIKAIEPGLDSHLVALTHDPDFRWHEIFRRPDLAHGPGVYWYSRPADGEVFYIGKAEADMWARISSHPGTAQWTGEAADRRREGTGRGWGFPRHRKLTSLRITGATRTSILAGDFVVGWAEVSPWQVALLLEVYLQALIHSTEGALPELNDKLG